jgi:hypothetical protein
MAQTRGDDLATLCRALRDNAAAAFGGEWQPAAPTPA